MTRQAPLYTALAFALVLAALALRAPGLSNDLPYQLDADEPVLFLSAGQILDTGAQTIKPGYSPLRLYELAAQQALLGVLSGEAGVQEQFFFFGRVFSALYMALLVAVTIQAGRALAGPAAGLLAALFLAVEPASAELGRLIRADALAWFLAVAALALTFCAARASAPARRPVYRDPLWTAFVLGFGAFLAKYNMLPVLAAPALVLLFRLAPSPRLRLGLLLAGLALLALGLASLRTSGLVRQILLERFALRRLFVSDYSFTAQTIDNAEILLSELGALHLVLAVFGLAGLWLRARRSALARLRAGALTLSALAAAAIYTLADARYKDMYYLVLCLALGWGAGLGALAGLVAEGLERLRASPSAPSLTGATFLAGLLLLTPWVRLDLQTLRDLEQPDTRIATAEWLRVNVPQGARVVCEYDCVDLQGGYGGFPGPQPFHTDVVDTLLERAPAAYRQNGVEYLIADGRADGGYLFVEPDPQFAAGVAEVARFEGPAYNGPARVLLRVSPLQAQPLYRWLGEAISFRGFDLPRTTVAAGDELELTLYWMSAYVTPANLIVFVHLTQDETRPPAAGWDSPPLDGTQPTWAWDGDMQFWIDARRLPLPAGLPPGDYRLQIGMYDADTGERLPVRSPEGEALGTVIELEKIRVLAEDDLWITHYELRPRPSRAPSPAPPALPPPPAAPAAARRAHESAS